MKRPQSQELKRLLNGGFADPFAVLGPHRAGGTRVVTVLLPDARAVTAISGPGGTEHVLPPLPGQDGLFAGEVPGDDAYRLRAAAGDGAAWEFDDPYRFGPVIGEDDLRVIKKGAHPRLWHVLGAHPVVHEDTHGVHFAVWAPNARRVSVVGGFNNWDGRRHRMRPRDGGVWEIFLPGLTEGEAYKYEIAGPDGALLPLKADPVGFGSEHPPGNASVVRDIGGYGWRDGEWMDGRAARSDPAAPVSIYEVHLASWRRRKDGRPISYREAAEELVAHAAEMGFTHIELMPMAEHPFDGSWGYQPVGLFAPTVRHGPPHEFRDLVDAAHRTGLGVILDWVPGHFPTDAQGLGRFDGTALYEHADPREGFHPDWNTYIYDYGRDQVRNFLVANARYWLEEYHIDGLRVDAVASMLYRDFSRAPGQWVPNRDGGRENYEAIAMLRETNAAVQAAYPGAVTVAEESTAYPRVTAPADRGGLGFDYKWNMGWMFDTLDYIRQPPEQRGAQHHRLTFGLTYAFDEAFVLAISHDEVVHGKGGMLQKMPGDGDERFATLRAFYGFMWGHPGKKLLFMGQEFGQDAEWDHAGSLDWAALDDPRHAGVRRLVRDLNALYRTEPALHERDTRADGFRWLEADDAANSVYAWLRHGNTADRAAAVICNLGAAEIPRYRIGLPSPGAWRVALCTDAADYGGRGRGQSGWLRADASPYQDQPASAEIWLPPLTALFLVPDD